MGVTSTTMACAGARAAPRAWALDLGTGSGYLALLAAEHSRQVLATDLNPRAVALTRFNAMLNRLENVEAAQGSLFEPAGDLRFDLIASNPPFVVSPEDGLMYRDSGLQFDAITEQIVRGAPGHLAEGGFAQVICNWVRIAGRDWVERLSGWFEGSDCDVWIVQGKSCEPGDYAQHWLGQTGPTPPDGFADDFERWMGYYERNRIEAIDAGFISLRAAAGGKQLDAGRPGRPPRAIQRGVDPAGIRRPRPGRSARGRRRVAGDGAPMRAGPVRRRSGSSLPDRAGRSPMRNAPSSEGRGSRARSTRWSSTCSRSAAGRCLSPTCWRRWPLAWAGTRARSGRSSSTPSGA